MKLISLNEIDLENSPMVRAEIDLETVDEYAQVYRAKKERMPPLDTFQLDGQKYLLLADGRHRYAALKKSGAKVVTVNIHKGTQSDCIRFALRANTAHGRRRTNADKRVAAALALRMFPKFSNAMLSEIARVDDHTIASVKRQMADLGNPRKDKVSTPETEDEGKLMGKDGRAVRPEAEPKAPEPKVDKPVERDEEGLPIPKGVLDYWERRQEIQELMTQVSRLKTSLEKIGESRDRLFFGINFQTVEASLSQVYATISNAKPWVVCTQCQGRPETQPNKACRLCGGKGFISRYQWDHLVPKEIRELRQKQVEQTKKK